MELVAHIFNYADILIARINFDVPSWKICIICARSLFAALNPYMGLVVAAKRDLMQYYKIFQEGASKLTHAIKMYV